MESLVSLPPQVQGIIKGFLHFTFGTLEWSTPTPPIGECTARISWWGDVPGSHEDLTLHPGATIVFPLRSRAAHVAHYFQDLGVQEILILQQTDDAPKAIAKVCIDMAAIAASDFAPFCQAVELVHFKKGTVMGTLIVEIEAEFYKKTTAGDKENVTFSGEVVVEDAETQMLLEKLTLLDSGGGGKENSTREALQAEEFVEPGINNISTPEINSESCCCGLPSENATAAAVPLATPTYDDDDDDDDDDGSGINSSAASVVVPLETEHQYRINVRIDSAFQLPPPQACSSSSSSSSSSPSLHPPPNSFVAYASAVWQRNRAQRVFTHLAAAHETPAVGGHAVVWKSSLNVTVDKEAFEMAAAAASSSTLGGVLDGALLLITVWRSGATAILPTAIQAVVPSPFDRLIGCAAIDISALLHEQQLQDRFPLIGAQHEKQGVVKATITPNDCLAAFLEKLSSSRFETGHSTTTTTTTTTTTLGTDTNTHKNNATTVVSSSGEEEEMEKGGNSVAPPPPEQPPPSLLVDGSTLHQHHPASSKQKFAWSGSDSDDGDAYRMVGVSFEGAVSCSEEEYDDDDDKNILNSSGGGAPLLINQDWMFDICKTVQTPPGVSADDNDDEEEEEEEEEALAAAAMAVERKPVVFKNKLLPGVVVLSGSPVAETYPAAAAAPYFSGTLEAALSVDSESRGSLAADAVNGDDDDGFEEEEEDGGQWIVPPEDIESFNAFHQQQASLNGDWMFDISTSTSNANREEQQGEEQKEKAKTKMISSQFAPMG